MNPAKPLPQARAALERILQGHHRPPGYHTAGAFGGGGMAAVSPEAVGAVLSNLTALLGDAACSASWHAGARTGRSGEGTGARSGISSGSGPDLTRHLSSYVVLATQQSSNLTPATPFSYSPPFLDTRLSSTPALTTLPSTAFGPDMLHSNRSDAYAISTRQSSQASIASRPSSGRFSDQHHVAAQALLALSSLTQAGRAAQVESQGLSHRQRGRRMLQAFAQEKGGAVMASPGGGKC